MRGQGYHTHIRPTHGDPASGPVEDWEERVDVCMLWLRVQGLSRPWRWRMDTPHFRLLPWHPHSRR